MKNLLRGIIFMSLLAAGNAFAGDYCGAFPNSTGCQPTHSVPEPGTFLMMASGAISVGGIALWLRKSK